MTETANEENFDERQREFSDKLKRQIVLAVLLCVLAILAGLFQLILASSLQRNAQARGFKEAEP